MEPLDDHELKQFASMWTVPGTPEHLHQQIFGTRQSSWWAWLFTGNIRVPVPACAVIVLLLAWLALDRQPDVASRPAPSSTSATVTLADFKPPAEIQVKVVRALP